MVRERERRRGDGPWHLETRKRAKHKQKEPPSLEGSWEGLYRWDPMKNVSGAAQIASDR